MTAEAEGRLEAGGGETRPPRTLGAPLPAPMEGSLLSEELAVLKSSSLLWRMDGGAKDSADRSGDSTFTSSPSDSVLGVEGTTEGEGEREPLLCM